MKEALKLALEWAESHGEIVFAGGGMGAVTGMNAWAVAVKEALAPLPEQEPVALVLAERERIKAANAPEIERINTYIKKLEDCIRARGNT